MNNPESNPYRSYNALDDFYHARQKATIQSILARLAGQPNDLLVFEQVRHLLGGIDQPKRVLKDIPLASIVGSVNRYTDFTRALLPLSDADKSRWAKVRQLADRFEGLPPIDVYQMGEVYFILDGHHRASVARELGATHIQANVQLIQTRVDLLPSDKIEDILLKAEYTEFLKQTRLDELREGFALVISRPGGYQKLLEHIALHHYDLALSSRHKVEYEDAVLDWYDHILVPSLQIIKNRKILADFPGRTEADFFLWAIEHQRELEDTLGWKVSEASSIREFDRVHRARAGHVLLRRIFRKMKSALVRRRPEKILAAQEMWAMDAGTRLDQTGLFRNIMVVFDKDSSPWDELDLACLIAHQEESFLGGLLVVNKKTKLDLQPIEELRRRFDEQCSGNKIDGHMVVVDGDLDEIVRQRAYWADLILFRLPSYSLSRLLRWLPNPMRKWLHTLPAHLLFCPRVIPKIIERIFLALDIGPAAQEMISLIAYLKIRWNAQVSVLLIKREGGQSGEYLTEVYDRLRTYGIDDVEEVCVTRDLAKEILLAAEFKACDLIVLGGFDSPPSLSKAKRQVIEKILISTGLPVLVCR